MEIVFRIRKQNIILLICSESNFEQKPNLKIISWFLSVESKNFQLGMNEAHKLHHWSFKHVKEKVITISHFTPFDSKLG